MIKLSTQEPRGTRTLSLWDGSQPARYYAYRHSPIAVPSARSSRRPLPGALRPPVSAELNINGRASLRSLRHGCPSRGTSTPTPKPSRLAAKLTGRTRGSGARRPKCAVREDDRRRLRPDRAAVQFRDGLAGGGRRIRTISTAKPAIAALAA